MRDYLDWIDIGEDQYPVLGWPPKPRTISKHCFKTTTRERVWVMRVVAFLTAIALRFDDWAGRVEDRGYYEVPNPDYDPAQCPDFPQTIIIGKSYTPLGGEIRGEYPAGDGAVGDLDPD